MNIHGICALGRSGELGKAGQLLWPIKTDLALFKQKTMGQVLVMGSTTLQSFNGRLLPGRAHWVLSKKATYESLAATLRMPVGTVSLANGNGPEGGQPALRVFTSMDDLLVESKALGLTDIWIIGGGQVYELCEPLYTDLHLTLIDAADTEATVSWSAFNLPASYWAEKSREPSPLASPLSMGKPVNQWECKEAQSLDVQGVEPHAVYTHWQRTTEVCATSAAPALT